MKKKISKIAVVAAFVAVSISFSGCMGTSRSKEEPKAFPVTVENLLVENAPNSVASLSPVLAQMLTELGYGAKIVGFPSDYAGEGATEVNKIGTGLEVDLAKVGELAPEIIFTTVPLPKEQIEKLAKVNVRVLVLPTVTTVEEIKQRYIDIATVMGGQFDGQTIGKKVGTEIDLQLATIAAAVPTKKTFLYIANLLPSVAGDNTIQATIISGIGTNAAAGIPEYSATPEQIATLNPDVIIYDNLIDPAKLLEDDVFSGMEAIKNSAIIGVDGNEMSLATNSFLKVTLKLANTVYSGVDFTATPPSSDDASK